MTKFSREYTKDTLTQNNQQQKERVKELKAAGWTLLGSGSRADVLRDPRDPTRVKKVGRYDGLPPEDGFPAIDGWLSYIKTFKGSRSKHFPKVYSVKLYKDFYEAEMEALQESDGRYYEDDYRVPSYERFAERVSQDKPDYVSWDLDEINVLYRPSTDSLVVTDPWASWSGGGYADAERDRQRAEAMG